MSFFKKKQSPIIVKQEIDYEKLADAIAKAISKSKKDKTENEENPVIVKSIEKALINIKKKEDDDNKKLIMTSGFFWIFPLFTLGLLAFISYCVAITALGLACYNFSGFTDEFSSYLSITFAGLFLAFLSGGATHEIYQMKDFNRIMAITSTLTSVIATIVSIVTLIITYKGIRK
ncbi:MAG: hypothetical protein K2K91_07180 [Ruminococcus sp.]|nr:hypothetical protein [Ruminococcus sp.]